MTRLILSLFLCLFINFVNAQQIFNVDRNGAVSPKVTEAKYGSFVFIIDKAFRYKKFVVYLADNTTIANSGNAELGPELSKNADDDNYTVTILPDRKIKGCTSCLSISENFSITLNDKPLGNFHFQPKINPDVEQPLSEAEVYHPGSMVNDALFIAANKNAKTKPGTVKSILEFYQIKDQTTLDKNEFLKADLQYAFTSEIQGALSLKSIASTVDGMDVTNIADGFAKFIVKRTKEELSISFFKKIKEEIDANKDLKSLFPKTHALLLVIDSEIYRYSNYLNNLREAFRADLNVIDQNLPALVDNHQAFFAKDDNFYLKASLLSGSYLSASLRLDQHPGDILQGFPLTKVFENPPSATKDKIETLKGGIQTLQLFSESLKENEPSANSYWVETSKLRQVIDNQDALKIYLGLLVEVAKNNYNKIPYKTGKDFYTLLNDQANVTAFNNDYPKYKEFLSAVNSKTSTLNKIIKDFDKTDSDSLKVEHYAKYFNTTVQLLESVTKLSSLSFLSTVPEVQTIADDSKLYFEVAYQVTDLLTAINRKRYPQVVNQAVLIYQSVYAKQALEQAPANSVVLSKKEKIEIAEQAIRANKDKKVSDVIASNEPYKSKVVGKDPDVAHADKTLSMIAKYGAFMANMIDAKNSDEVQEAIESVALPVGSASIKRESSFNVSLNAYCGLFVGNEIIRGVDKDKPFDRFNSFGVTAPIGISVSKGISKGWSTSLFLSVLDLGAITAFRFADDQTEQVPTIKLKDIISPGIFLSIGIPKTPISFNAGAQVGPNLRKVTADANDYSDKLYTRYSLSICVDIPLLNLYTKSKK